jgi:hypothetical protein
MSASSGRKRRRGTSAGSAGGDGNRALRRDVKADVANQRVLRIGALVAGLALTACGSGPAGSGGPPSSTATGAGETTTSTAAAGAGVEGTVSASPTCPVERADQPCPARPVQTELRLVRADGSVAARGRSGTDGRFRIEVAPARYRLEADDPGGAGRGCTPVGVAVEPGRYNHADIDCDTGIR